MKKHGLLSLWVLVAMLCMADAALAANTIDNTIKQYQSVGQDFGNRVREAGISLLWKLLAIQVAWNAINALLKRKEMEDLLAGMAYSIFSAGFFMALMVSHTEWLPAIIHSFDLVGQKGSGMGQLTPSAIIMQAGDIIDLMLGHFQSSEGWMALLKNFLPSLLLVFGAVVILVSMCILALQMALAMISGYFWLAVMPILLGFGGMHFTKDIAVNALKGGVTIGMKIMVVYLVASIASTLAPLWGDMVSQLTITNFGPLWEIVFGAALLAYLSFQLPKLAADLMNGTASLSAGDAASNVMVGAAGLAAAGAGAYGAAKATTGLGTGTAAGLGGLAKAVGAGLDSASDLGKSGAGALGHAVGAVASHGLGLAAGGIGDAIGGAGSTFGDRVNSSTGGKIASSIDASRGGSVSAASGSQAASAPAAATPASSAGPAPTKPGLSHAPSDVPTDFRGSAPLPTGQAGSASSASISSSSSAPTPADKSGRAVHEKLRDLQGYVPQDQSQVGLSANIGAHAAD